MTVWSGAASLAPRAAPRPQPRPPEDGAAKYVPGLAAVATTLAGETRIPVARFALYDGIGAALWAGGAGADNLVLTHAAGATPGRNTGWRRVQHVVGCVGERRCGVPIRQGVVIGQAARWTRWTRS